MSVDSVHAADEPELSLPASVCPVIATFYRTWNFGLQRGKHQAQLHALIPGLVGTRADAATQDRRAMMAADWLIREATPAWLRLVGLDDQAARLVSLVQIVDLAQIGSIRGPVKSASEDAEVLANKAEKTVFAAAWSASTDRPRDLTARLCISRAYDDADRLITDCGLDAVLEAAQHVANGAAVPKGTEHLQTAPASDTSSDIERLVDELMGPPANEAIPEIGEWCSVLLDARDAAAWAATVAAIGERWTQGRVQTLPTRDALQGSALDLLVQMSNA